MKFMKRGQPAEATTRAASSTTDIQEAPSKSSEDERWVARTPQGGCIVISEPDPPPGALLGHMTFGGFNPALEQLQEEAEKRLQEAKRKRDGSSTSVKQDGDGTGLMQEAAVQSMRMQKRAKHPKR
ncbi:g10161 [Coccomyxa viridis]|uniref:G10161 protein n=1 Tax=Coccomyxa viridis TaxID=1274662 RepID=A0ABP1G7D0_9CHLO